LYDDLHYETSIENGVTKISYDAKIIGRSTKVYVLYMIKGSNTIGYTSIAR